MPLLDETNHGIAREIEADENVEAFELTFKKKVVPPKLGAPSSLLVEEAGLRQAKPQSPSKNR
jgi:hypothetical protein